jgi:hypothetical protein
MPEKQHIVKVVLFIKYQKHSAIAKKSKNEKQYKSSNSIFGVYFKTRNIKEVSITLQLTSCLTGLD